MGKDNNEFNLSGFTKLSRQKLWGHLFVRTIKDAPYNSETVLIYFSDFFCGRFMGMDGKQYEVDGRSLCGKYEVVDHITSHGLIK